MNESLVARIKQHIAAGGIATSFVPGDGYERLSGKTCCTYLHDRHGAISFALLETHPSDDVEEAAEFLCQQVVFAYSPSIKMQEMGIVGPKSKHVVVITHFDGLPKEKRDYIYGRILSLSSRSIDMGHVSDWSPDEVEAMTK